MLFVFSAHAEEDFNTNLISKISEILKTEPPVKVEIEFMVQEKLQNEYEKYLFTSCLRTTKGNVKYCQDYSSDSKVFIYGLWIPEEPGHFHAKIYEKAGMDTIIHEYLHWWLHYRTEPNGVINNEQMVQYLTSLVITSPTFLKWLGG